MFLNKGSIIFWMILSSVFFACNEDDTTTLVEPTAGTGMLNFLYTPTSIQMNVYYYLPENFNDSTPIVFLFHGAERNAEAYRDAMIPKASSLDFIVVAPEFSQSNFPDGSGYNMGNVFTNGNNPTSVGLNPEEEWAFSIIESLFNTIKNEFNNTNNFFQVIGHSAGAQFAHRLLMFKPNIAVDKMVVSAAGWYTFPDVEISFPYGLANSPLENISLSHFFSKNLILQIGENDNNPNAAGLRRNEFADAQGLNRKERAMNYFQFSEVLAQDEELPFAWNFHLIPNLNHDFNAAISMAADLLFEN